MLIRADPRFIFFNKIEGLLLYVRVVAEAVEPVDVGFATEPGELALGVVAVGLGRGPDGEFAVDFAAQVLCGLFTAE